MSKPVVSEHVVHPGSITSYSIGFGLSLILTLVAYFAASHQLANGWALIITLAVLAVTQLIVQLLFFLHLSSERGPRWNLSVFLFAAMVVTIIVFGSLWIMKNLDYGHHHLQPVNESDRSIIKDEGF